MLDDGDPTPGPDAPRTDADPREPSVTAHLDRLGVPYEVITIDPAYADTRAFCERYGYPPEQSANTILVASKKGPKRLAACVVLAPFRLDVNNRVRKLMAVKKASFASAEQMQAVTGMQVGGVTPFGLPEAIPLYVDAGVMTPDWIILGGGGRRTKIKVTPQVFHQMPQAQVIENLATPLPPRPAPHSAADGGTVGTD